jgi:NADPH:quinone reductase-like Zn-dependent oxidoreductase
MKIIEYTEFGPPEVFQIREKEKPAPKDHEVLIKVHSTPVSFGDLMARNFKRIKPGNFTMPFIFWLPSKFYFGWNKPKKNILGSEFSGMVATVGKKVTKFNEGDSVFGYLGQNFGAYAEYFCMPANGLVAMKPSNMTFEEASAISYGGLTAWSLLKKSNLPGFHSTSGEKPKVLINGASGGIGSSALQLARNYYGAEVTGVCSTPRIDYVKDLGADHVIDYKIEDFTKNGETYDLIIDILGKSSFASCKKSLKPGGYYLLASFKGKQLIQMIRTSFFAGKNGKKVVCALSGYKQQDLELLRDLVEEGKMNSIIDKRFPMEKVAEAHNYAESGQKKENIIIKMENRR